MTEQSHPGKHPVRSVRAAGERWVSLDDVATAVRNAPLSGDPDLMQMTREALDFVADNLVTYGQQLDAEESSS